MTLGKVSTRILHEPTGYWQDVKNQRDFLDKLATRFKITKPDEWLSVTTKEVLSEGGSFVNNYYDGSLRRGNAYHCDQLTIRLILY
jgi:hypothetical protein